MDKAKQEVINLILERARNTPLLHRRICWWMSDAQLKETIKKIKEGDRWAKKLWIECVLNYGRTEDIIKLDFDEVRKLLPEIRIYDERRRKLWRRFFQKEYSPKNKEK